MKKTLLTITAGIICLLTYGQDVVSSSGKSLASGTAHLDFTIGETLTATHPSQNAQLTQGFHQTNLHVASISEHDQHISIEVFPNPVVDVLTVHSSEPSEAFQIKLIDLNGSTIALDPLVGSTMEYPMSQLPAGTYFIDILDATNQTIKTFQIIKLH